MSSCSSPIKHSSTSNSRVRLGRGIVPVPGSRKLCPNHALAHDHRLQAARMTKGCGGCCSCKSKHVLHLSIALLPTSLGLNIVLTNDDGWATANIRSVYNSLSASDHHVLLVAPPNQPSGVGGTFVLPVNKSLYKAADFNYIPKGAPSWGHEPNNSMIWYLDGSPSACAIYAEDVLAPKYLPGGKVDLLVAGPNEGDNQGSAGFPQSGTIGAAYTSNNKGIPGIAFSTLPAVHRFYGNITSSMDPAILIANQSARLIDSLNARYNGTNTTILPLGIGLNVNYPLLTVPYNDSCVTPKFVFTRSSGGSPANGIMFDNMTGLYKSMQDFSALSSFGGNVCLNGKCNLPESFRLARDAKRAYQFSLPILTRQLGMLPLLWVRLVALS